MNIFLDTIGCRLNQSEIEKMAAQFRAAGHTIVSEARLADWVVVNTCAVTAAAASDSRQAIRHAARSEAGKIIATGCWATLEVDKALVMPKVDRVVPNQEKDSLVSSLLKMDLDKIVPVERRAVPGDHSRTRAFIKVQDGCNNGCTFCITRIARGRSRSRVTEDVLQDINMALAGGANEIVLTGVHLGSWGKDFSPALSLPHLIESILNRTKVPRLRLSSLEPWDIDPDFFSLWPDKRLCPHFHLPLQSGSETVLRRMARKTTLTGFLDLVERIRKKVPDAAITTDIIVGFPGETDNEFEKSLSFIQEIQFSAGHIFHFSPRPGTPAASFPNQVSRDVIRRRSQECRTLFGRMGDNFHLQQIGKRVDVLWESGVQQTDGSWTMEGWTRNYIRVQAKSEKKVWNHEHIVELNELISGGMLGKIIELKTGKQPE